MVRRTRAQTRIEDHFKPSTPETRWPAGSSTRPPRGRKPVYESESESEGSEGIAGIKMTQKDDGDDQEDGSEDSGEGDENQEDEEEALSPMKRRRVTDRSRLRRPNPKIRPESTMSVPVRYRPNEDSDDEEADDEVEAVIDIASGSDEDTPIPVDDQGDVIILEEPPDSFGGADDVIEFDPSPSDPPPRKRIAKRVSTKPASLSIPRRSNGTASSSRTPVAARSPLHQYFSLSKQKLKPYVEVPSRSPSILSTQQSQPPPPPRGDVPPADEPEFTLGDPVSDDEAGGEDQVSKDEDNVPLVIPPSTGKKRQRSVASGPLELANASPASKSRVGTIQGIIGPRRGPRLSPVKKGERGPELEDAEQAARGPSSTGPIPPSERHRKRKTVEVEERASQLRRGARVDYSKDTQGTPEREAVISENSEDEVVSTPKKRTAPVEGATRRSRARQATTPPIPVVVGNSSKKTAIQASRSSAGPPSEPEVQDDDDDVLPELDLRPLIERKKATVQADDISEQDVPRRELKTANGKSTDLSHRSKQSTTRDSLRKEKEKGKAKANARTERSKAERRNRRHATSSSDHDEGKGGSVAIEDLEMDEPERFKTKSRLRNKPKETAFQRRLRKLKEKKMGIEKDTSESEEEDDAIDVESATSDSAAEDSDEDEFIVDDGDEVTAQLPAQFSNDRNQTPEFKFKVVFQYFVMLVIKGPSVIPLKGEAAEDFPPFIHDLRRLIQGHRDSRVRSQIWRTEFVQALQAFPIFHTMHDEFTHDGCDACHMSGRVSHWEITLEGTPYDKETHEPLDSGSDSESSDDARKRPNTKTKGKLLEQVKKFKGRRRRRDSSESAPEEEESENLPRKFFMGRFCKARSEVYHAMSHWGEPRPSHRAQQAEETEDELFLRVRGYYKDLLRAKDIPLPSDSEATSSSDDSEEDEVERQVRREKRRARAMMTAKRVRSLKNRRDLPRHKDVNNVTEWMDRMGWQANDFRWFNDMITRSERLEYDRRTDD